MKHIKTISKVDPKMALTTAPKLDTILKTPEEKQAKKDQKAAT